jgi:anti-sigma B factor antagonist
MLKVYKRKLGDVTVLCLQGRLVTGETETLRETVVSEVNAVALVLDLARVSRIDAGGLGVLLKLREQTLAKGMEFRLTNVTKLVQQVLEITRLDSVFETLSERSVSVVGSPGPLAMVLETAPCA